MNPKLMEFLPLTSSCQNQKPYHLLVRLWLQVLVSGITDSHVTLVQSGSAIQSVLCYPDHSLPQLQVRKCQSKN